MDDVQVGRVGVDFETNEYNFLGILGQNWGDIYLYGLVYTL